MKRVRVYKEIISDENLRLAIQEVNAGHRRNGNHSLNKKVIEIENNFDDIRRIKLLKAVVDVALAAILGALHIVLHPLLQCLDAVGVPSAWDACDAVPVHAPHNVRDHRLHNSVVNILVRPQKRLVDVSPFAFAAVRVAIPAPSLEGRVHVLVSIDQTLDECSELLHIFIEALKRVFKDTETLWLCDAIMEYGVLIGAFFSAWFLHLTLQPLDLMIHQKQYGVSHYLRQMDNFTIFGSNKRKLRKLLDDIKKWLAEIGMKIKGNWQIFRVGFTPKVERAHQALPKKKQRHRRPRLPSALGYRFGHGYTILRKHNLFRLKQSLHLYYYRRDRNRVISFKRASGLISRLGQLRKCNHQQVLDRHYQPKTMFALKKVVRKECRRLQALYPPYQAA